jgi:hypothetical protein
MIITSHMQKIIKIYPCLLKLSRQQYAILNIGDFWGMWALDPSLPPTLYLPRDDAAEICNKYH